MASPSYGRPNNDCNDPQYYQPQQQPPPPVPTYYTTPQSQNLNTQQSQPLPIQLAPGQRSLNQTYQYPYGLQQQQQPQQQPLSLPSQQQQQPLPIPPPNQQAQALLEVQPPNYNSYTITNNSNNNSNNNSGASKDYEHNATQALSSTYFGNRGSESTTCNPCIRCFIQFLVWMFVIITFPFAFCWYFHVVYEYERAIIFRMGIITSPDKSSRGGSSGIFFTLPCIDEFRKVDMRTTCSDFPPQEVLTKDNVNVKIDGVVYYRVYNAIMCLTRVGNAHLATNLLAQSTLRNLIATKELAEVMTEREAISEELRNVLDNATHSWGIRVENIGIRDIKLPMEMQRALALEAEATKEAKAKVIVAQGEQETSKALKDASEIIASSPGALQLRYLQTLSNICNTNKNATIVPFPLPMELLGSFQPTAKKSLSASPDVRYYTVRRTDRGTGSEELHVEARRK